MDKKILTVIVLIVVVIGGFLIYKNSSDSSMSDQTQSTTSVDQTAPVQSVSTTREFTVNGSKFAFDPKEITVKKGDTVKINFVNKDGFHDLVIDEFNVATKQINGGAEETVTFVADKTGSFQYYCSVGTHRAMGMWGTLIVE